ncbi:hypothetical protein EIP91_000069 [Steccherinum ochraceum]|uniref:Transmembrane protein n=1 Tax=Steccherinum ochraceum TaxID=92696 RepID=A0A4V2MXY7_9APHY|nr:hypothetical protein EIP91_000069 [Steccherinum ochraceum]
MPDWTSPDALALEAAAFLKLMHVLAGIYFWEFSVSLDFDWMYITGKKKFQWPMLFYFLNRYCLFFALIGILIALDATTKIDCQSLYTFNQGMPGVLLKASWIDGAGCVITQTNTTVLSATFIYSMCFDLTVLVLSAVKLFRRRGASQIVKLLFKDGLVFFVIAFIANLCATTFMVMNLNAVMSVIFNVPAAVASTIVACRAVRRLNTFSSSGAEVYSGSANHPAVRSREVAFASAVQSPTQQSFAVKYPGSGAQGEGTGAGTGIHVQMDTFTVTDSHDELRNKSSGRDNDSDVEAALESKSAGL